MSTPMRPTTAIRRPQVFANRAKKLLKKSVSGGSKPGMLRRAQKMLIKAHGSMP